MKDVNVVVRFTNVVGGDDVECVFSSVKQLAENGSSFSAGSVVEYSGVTGSAVLEVLRDMHDDRLITFADGVVYCESESPIMKRELRFSPLLPAKPIFSKHGNKIRVAMKHLLSLRGEPVANWIAEVAVAVPGFKEMDKNAKRAVKDALLFRGILDFVGERRQRVTNPAATPISQRFSQCRELDLNKVTPEVPVVPFEDDNRIVLWSADFTVLWLVYYLVAKHGNEANRAKLTIAHGELTDGKSKNLGLSLRRLVELGLVRVIGEGSGASRLELARELTKDDVELKCRRRTDVGWTLEMIQEKFGVLETALPKGEVEKSDSVEEVDAGESDDDELEADDVEHVRLSSGAILFWYILWCISGQEADVRVKAVDIRRAWNKLVDTNTYTADYTGSVLGADIAGYNNGTGPNSRWWVTRSPVDLVHERYGGRDKYALPLEEVAATLGVTLKGKPLVFVEGDVAGNGNAVPALSSRAVAFWRLLWLMAGEETGGVVSREDARVSWDKVVRLLMDSLGDVLAPLIAVGAITANNGHIEVHLSPELVTFVVSDNGNVPTLDQIREALEASNEPPPTPVFGPMPEPTGVDMSGLDLAGISASVRCSLDPVITFLRENHSQMSSSQLDAVLSFLRDMGVSFDTLVTSTNQLKASVEEIRSVRKAHDEIHAQERQLQSRLGDLIGD